MNVRSSNSDGEWNESLFFSEIKEKQTNEQTTNNNKKKNVDPQPKSIMWTIVALENNEKKKFMSKAPALTSNKET